MSRVAPAAEMRHAQVLSPEVWQHPRWGRLTEGTLPNLTDIGVSNSVAQRRFGDRDVYPGPKNIEKIFGDYLNKSGDCNPGFLSGHLVIELFLTAKTNSRVSVRLDNVIQIFLTISFLGFHNDQAPLES
jgi:hypothetical protein